MLICGGRPPKPGVIRRASSRQSSVVRSGASAPAGCADGASDVAQPAPITRSPAIANSQRTNRMASPPLGLGGRTSAEDDERGLILHDGDRHLPRLLGDRRTPRASLLAALQDKLIVDPLNTLDRGSAGVVRRTQRLGRRVDSDEARQVRRLDRRALAITLRAAL